MADAATAAPSSRDGARAQAAEEARQAKVQGYLDELAEIRDYLAPVRDKQDRRLVLYQHLRNLRVPDKVIAEYNGTTQEAIRVALAKVRKNQRANDTKNP